MAGHADDGTESASIIKPAPGCDRLTDRAYDWLVSPPCTSRPVQSKRLALKKEPSSSSRERERRALASRFLSHFLGDLRQRLHVGHIEDLGGNVIKAKSEESRETRTDNLHAVWDSAVRRAGLTIIQDAHDLNAEITATEATQCATFTIADWASESEALARQKAYVKLDGTDVQQNDFLNDAYFAPAIATAKQRIKQAGVRLAMLIEAAAAGTMPEHLLEGDAVTVSC